MYDSKECRLNDVAANMARSVEKALSYNEIIKICINTKYSDGESWMDEVLAVSNANLHYIWDCWTKEYGKGGSYKLWPLNQISGIYIKYKPEGYKLSIWHNNANINIIVTSKVILENFLDVIQKYADVEIDWPDKN